MTVDRSPQIILLTHTMSSDKKYTLEDYATKETNVWCPGCGDFAILQAVKMALFDIQADPTQTMIVSGIGCSSQMPHWVNVNGFHGIHGRALPVATGMKLANPGMNILVHGGDGDGYGIGAGHFIHAMRRNINLTYIVHNNQIYGLTKGQASPTSEKGHKTASTPYGSPDNPIDPLKLAIVSGATFVARGASSNLLHLKELIVQGMNHRGFSLIDVMQPCVTFNKVNTYGWLKETSYIFQDEYPSDDMHAALQKTEEFPDKVPLGVYYETTRPTHEEEMGISEKPPVAYNHSQPDISQLLQNYY